MTGPPALNDRQRTYLLAIFAVDEELEAEMLNLPYIEAPEPARAGAGRA